MLHGTLYATIYGIDRLHAGCGFGHIIKVLARITDSPHLCILVEAQKRFLTLFLFSNVQTSSGKNLPKRLLGEVKRVVLCRPEVFFCWPDYSFKEKLIWLIFFVHVHYTFTY